MDNLTQILEEVQAVANNRDDYTYSMNSTAITSDYCQPLEATSSQVKPIARKSKSGSKSGRRSWKRPKDKPKRPLSAYNLFFQHERNNILAALPSNDDAAMDDGLTEEERRRKHRKTHGKIGFADLARIIADKWKNVEPTAKSVFEARADIEKQRYKKELEVWKLKHAGSEAAAKSSSKKKSSKSRSSRSNKQRMTAAAVHPDLLASLMSANRQNNNNTNDPRTQMMQVLSNPLFNQQQQQQFQQQQFQQHHQQQQLQAPTRNSHNELMAQCAQNLMRTTNSALPLSCLSQIKSLQQPVAAGVSPLAALQQQHQEQLQQTIMVDMVPDETFSKETFFEDHTDDDATYSGDDYYSGDSYSGDSYDSSDDDMDAFSTDSTLEDDLNEFLAENEVLFPL